MAPDKSEDDVVKIGMQKPQQSPTRYLVPLHLPSKIMFTRTNESDRTMTVERVEP